MRLLAAFSLLALAACGQVLPRPVDDVDPLGTGAQRPRPAAEPKAAPPIEETEVDEPTPKEAPFTLAWKQQTAPFHKGVAVAASGHVAVLASRSLSLHDGRSGAEIARRDVCFTFADGFGFVDESTGALVCENGIELLALPTLEHRGMRALDGKARAAAFGGGRVAVAFADGQVRVLSTADWQELRAIAGTEMPSVLAVSDERVAIGLESGVVRIVEIASGAETRIESPAAYEPAALAFAPDGKRLFVAAGPFAGVWDVASGRFETTLRTVTGVRAARWLGDTAVATAGDDGLLVVDAASGAAQSLPGGDGTPVALAAASGGTVLCAGAGDGQLGCWSRGVLPPSRELPLIEPGPVDAVRTVGRVLGHEGNTLRVKAMPQAPVPPVGVDVILLRYVETQVGDLRRARWVELANARVRRVKADVVSLELPSALHQVEGLDDPLGYDAPVKLAWDRP
jgi:hypothetical protein